MKIKEIVIQIADDYDLKLSLEQARELKRQLDELLDPPRLTVTPWYPCYPFQPSCPSVWYGTPSITTTDVTVRSVES